MDVGLFCAQFVTDYHLEQCAYRASVRVSTQRVSHLEQLSVALRAVSHTCDFAIHYAHKSAVI